VKQLYNTVDCARKWSRLHSSIAASHSASPNMATVVEVESKT